MDVKTVFSTRGKMLMIVDNTKFYKRKSLTGGRVFWRCSTKKCNARLYTNKDNEIIKTNLSHNHDIDESNKKLRRLVLSSNLKKKVMDNLSLISIPTSELINQELEAKSENSTDINITKKDVDNIRRNLYNAKRKLVSLAQNKKEPDTNAAQDSITDESEPASKKMYLEEGVASTSCADSTSRNTESGQYDYSWDSEIKSEIKEEIEIEDESLNSTDGNVSLKEENNSTFYDEEENNLGSIEDAHLPTDLDILISASDNQNLSGVDIIPINPTILTTTSIDFTSPVEISSESSFDDGRDSAKIAENSKLFKELSARNLDHVDAFFYSVSAVVKTFPPELIAEIKVQIQKTVNEMEQRAMFLKKMLLR